MKRLINLSIIIIGCIAIHGQSRVPEEYLGMALENNPGLQAKYKAFEASLQEVTRAKSLPDPGLSAGYFVWPVETRVGPQRFRVSLSQMFPWFGTLKARGDVAAFMAEAKYQAFLDATNEVFYNVAEIWYMLYEMNKKQELELDNRSILESYKNIATRKFESGTGAMADVLRTDILLQESLTNSKVLEIKERELRVRFNLLLNRDEEAEIIIADSLHLDRDIELKIPGKALASNPRVKQLDYRIAASQKNEVLAEKQGMPEIGIGLDYVIVGERPGMDLTGNGKDVLMPMVSLSIPVFRKKYRAAVKEAELTRENYKLQKMNVINTLDAKYESARFQVDQKRELITLYNKQAGESKQVLNLLFSAYSNSGKEFEEVLLVQQQLLKYAKQEVEATASYFTALANITYRVSGIVPDFVINLNEKNVNSYENDK
jgi:outer membrane protein TolC